ncbi:MAG: ATP-binding cassette domain-containing protein [Betaproteobacteria bacterium]|nr:ATP-binding cassette domain-containing protein [Betaproteobacteria bacterium]
MREAAHMVSDAHIRLRLARAGFVLDVNLHLPGRGITVLFGPSGSGKTTLLRCVAGLDRAGDAPDAHVTLGGVVWQDAASGVFVPTWQRALGYVFQEASLLEHLDVRQNLVFALRGGRGNATAHAGPQEAIALLGIGHLLDRRVDTLSGGERRRVEIARALATQPRFILLDEPFAGIDPIAVIEIQRIINFLKSRNIGVLITDHNVRETLGICDHAYIISEGRVLAQGLPSEIVENAEVRRVYLGENFRM